MVEKIVALFFTKYTNNEAIISPNAFLCKHLKENVKYIMPKNQRSSKIGYIWQALSRHLKKLIDMIGEQPKSGPLVLTSVETSKKRNLEGKLVGKANKKWVALAN